MTCEFTMERGFWNSFGFFVAAKQCSDDARYCTTNPDGTLERLCAQHALEKAQLGFEVYLYEERVVSPVQYELTRLDERFLRSMRIEP